MDRFTALELFVRIAETGSLSRAAQSLSMSTPAASRHLAALENRLAVRLVERNTRRLYLTREGQAFHERAQAVLADLHDAETLAQGSQLEPAGVLRVSASLSFAMQLIAPRLHRYRALYPHVRVHIDVQNRYLDLIESGVDVAIRTREFEPDSSITIRRLAATRRVLCAAPSYLAQRGVPAHPGDLPKHDLLVYVYANRSHELALTRLGTTETITVQGVLESNDGQVLRAAALHGMGILVQPSYIVYDDIVAGRLVPVLNDWDLPHLQINIAYPSRKFPPARVRSFIDFMADEFERHDYERKWTSFMGLKGAADSA